MGMGSQESPPMTVSLDVQVNFVELTQTSFDIDCNENRRRGRRRQIRIYLQSGTMASEDNKQSDADLRCVEPISICGGDFHMWRLLCQSTIKPDAIEAAVEVNGWNGQVRIRRFRIRHCSPPQHSKVQERWAKSHRQLLT